MIFYTYIKNTYAIKNFYDPYKNILITKSKGYFIIDRIQSQYIKMNNHRINFRKLAFQLQIANKYHKIDLICEMIRLMENENDRQEIKLMQKTIIANIVNHNIVLGLNNNERARYRDTSSMATYS